jgi:putative SOS response-associated peptidase YedK
MGELSHGIVSQAVHQGVQAGIWDRGRDASSKTLETSSILTTTANAVTSAVHARMPAILAPDDDLWLDPIHSRSGVHGRLKAANAWLDVDRQHLCDG